jgi:hypothetical protein
MINIVRKLVHYFSIPIRLTILNGILLFLAVMENCIFQVFCNPSLWASIVITICFINSTVYPLCLRNKIAIPITSFVNGISFFLFLYCTIFLGSNSIIALFVFIIGLLGLIPLFFLLQLFWNNIYKVKSNSIRFFFFCGLSIGLIIATYVGKEYNKAIKDIKQFEKSNYTTLHKTFYTEKILGMHFIYHTQFCFFDGWRPPIHEPILVFGFWFNNKIDPLHVDLQTRIALYKKFFPKNNIKKECSCAKTGRNEYNNDKMLR